MQIDSTRRAGRSLYERCGGKEQAATSRSRSGSEQVSQASAQIRDALIAMRRIGCIDWHVCSASWTHFAGSIPSIINAGPGSAYRSSLTVHVQPLWYCLWQLVQVWAIAKICELSRPVVDVCECALITGRGTLDHHSMALRNLTCTLVDLLQPIAAGSRQLLPGHQLASTTSGLTHITERLQSRWSLDSWLKSWQESSWLAVPKKKVSLLKALKLLKTFWVESPNPAGISS